MEMQYQKTLPPQCGGQWRKKPNENETGVTSRGREWKSSGMGRKAQKRVKGAPKRNTSLHMRFVEVEERWDALDPLQGILPQNWGGTEPRRTITCMVLKAKANASCTSSTLP
ncbi:hypothetical protein TNCV_4233981 [Trichonephila clavipes]|nr:hypothetical protein TNCV_4233981 [Trichonephila clavipes]